MLVFPHSCILKPRREGYICDDGWHNTARAEEAGSGGAGLLTTEPEDTNMRVAAEQA